MKTDKTPSLLIGALAFITACLAGAKTILELNITWFQVFLPFIAFFTTLVISGLIMLYAWGRKNTGKRKHGAICPCDSRRCDLYDSTSDSSPCAICNRFKSKEDGSTNK